MNAKPLPIAARFCEACLILFVAALLPFAACAAEIKVLASPAVRSALMELIPRFEQSTGHKVVAAFDVIAVVKRRIDAGEPFDIAIVSPAVADDLVSAGKIAAGSRTAFARAGLGMAIAKGLPKPDISTADGLRRALMNAKTVAYSKEGASGTNFLAVLKDLGIAEQMQGRLLPSTTNLIEKGEAELAVSGTGPAMEMKGADYLGAFPREVQRYVALAAGVSASSADAGAAKALLSFMLAPAAAPVFHSKGLEPGVN